jgi:hypothetical protein
LLNISGGEAGLAPETAIVIAAALNDLNDKLIALDAVVSATLVNHEDRIQTLEE